MKIPQTLTVIPNSKIKIRNGYSHLVSPRVKKIKAKRTWRQQARRILLSWGGVDRVVVKFDDGSENSILWETLNAQNPQSPMGKLLTEINSRRSA
jgi:hypothetical protein